MPLRAKLCALLVAFPVALAGCSLSDDDGGSDKPATTPGTPATGVKSDQPEAAAQLGFPDVAKICMLQSYHQPLEVFEILFNKKKYDGLLPTEMRRLRELEEENGRLKKIVADLTLDREMLQDIVRRKL